MSHPKDLEEMYSNLYERLGDLCEVLLHSSLDVEVVQAFRVAGTAAIELFELEEREMEASKCPALELNRAGHDKFRQEISNLYAQYRGERSGIRAAGDLRRNLMPWLQEHHVLVDRQLAHHLKKLGSASSSSARA
jgi:hemerythrin